ncbi:MAG: hypothetical protein CMB24_00805 [Euryarchaeota archaeon]|nr:hypothetical protein [Euryarchaeota archaeon]|tara:strand:- start:12847 stop:15276 length:2430 start_codon:yes stop_codon:yes gene_type:complete
MRRAVLVALLLSLALLPSVQSSGGVIDSVSVVGSGEMGEGPVNVNITLVGVGGANSASVNWSVSLSGMDGTLIDSDSGNALIDDGVNYYVETMLGDAPLGLSNLTIILSGDIGAPGQDQWTTYHTTIQRLRPLDISIGNPIFNPVDSQGLDSGNLTINDGDYVRIDVPVINDGDVPWNGTLELSVDSLNIDSQVVNISGDTTQIHSFLTSQVTEGTHFVNATLIGPSDTNSGDELYSGQFDVSPPPLPSITLELDSLNEPEPGSQISWNISAYNSGESSFDGGLVCFFDGQQVFMANVSIVPLSTNNSTFSIPAKPGDLVCTTQGARTGTTINATETISMTSAIFIGAGHSTPSLLGGPWHAGDEITLSLLLRNEGDAIGSAMMQIEIDGITINGSSTTLEEGKAGEVSHEFSFTTAGDHIVNWSVFSPDGAVDSNLSGSIQIPVQPSQVISVQIESVEIVDEGIEIAWSVDLSDGRERLAIIDFGVIQDGLKGERVFEERNLLPGITYGSMNIGFQDGQKVFAGVSESGWTIGFGSYTEDEFDLPQFSITPQITVNPSTGPKVPSENSKVTVSYTLAKTGNGIVPPGQIVVTDGNGNILGSDISPELTSNSMDSNTVVTWPSGENVKIIVYWHVDGQTVSDEVMVTSEVVESSEEEFSIPWGGILGGLALGMVLIFAIRIKTSPKDEKDKKKKVKKSPKKDEKVEVACPTCDRRLNVPRTYTGGVRCPECETKFDVEGESETDEDLEETSKKEAVEDNQNETESLWSSSSDDILGCPKCARKLKVPYDRRPAKAKCPACQTIFEARAK